MHLWWKGIHSSTVPLLNYIFHYSYSHLVCGILQKTKYSFDTHNICLKCHSCIHSCIVYLIVLYFWENYARAYVATQCDSTVASFSIYVTSSGSDNKIMVMPCWHLAMASLSLVWITEVAWGHAGSLIYRLNLATHCHMGHEWACYPPRQSASHLCPLLGSPRSAITQWGHSSGQPVGHGFYFNIQDSWKKYLLTVFPNQTPWKWNKHTNQKTVHLNDLAVHPIVYKYTLTMQSLNVLCPQSLSLSQWTHLEKDSAEWNLAIDADEANYRSNPASLTLMFCTH